MPTAYAMSSLSSSVGITVLMIGCVFGQAPRNSHPPPLKASTRLQLTAIAEPPGARLGGTVILKLRLKNVTSKVIRVGDSGFDTDYDLDVADRSGNVVARTDFGRSLLDGVLLRSTSRDIAPGEEVPAELEITRIYDLRLPGLYYARAVFRAMSAEDPEDNKRFAEQAFSNPVEFTILP
jgi:hypothetical protein